MNIRCLVPAIGVARGAAPLASADTGDSRFRWHAGDPGRAHAARCQPDDHVGWQAQQIRAESFRQEATLGFSASGTLKRSDFGISTFVPVIGDDISITIDAEFNRNP